jgi:hypothetical protein
MPLPKIELPIYDVKLVSLVKPVKFRPFLVKEEKLLLMALQTNDEEAILNAIKQVVNNCLLEESLDIDKLPIFDLEYMFLNIRARSVGEEIETYYLCRNKITEKDAEGNDVEVDCAHMMPIKINVLDIKPPIDDLSSKIQITKNIGIQLKYPTLKTFAPLKNMVSSGENDSIFNLIYDCSEYVYDADGLYYTKETTREEFANFLDSLTQEQFDRIIGFFESLPEISHDVKHNCEKCGFEHDIHLEGLNDFFI